MMKKQFILFLALQIIIACRTYNPSDAGSETKLLFHEWAPTPPMGWNSWDCYGPTVVENEVKANADYMAAHLKKFGWNIL